MKMLGAVISSSCVKGSPGETLLGHRLRHRETRHRLLLGLRRMGRHTHLAFLSRNGHRAHHFHKMVLNPTANASYSSPRSINRRDVHATFVYGYFRLFRFKKTEHTRDRCTTRCVSPNANAVHSHPFPYLMSRQNDLSRHRFSPDE